MHPPHDSPHGIYLTSAGLLSHKIIVVCLQPAQQIIVVYIQSVPQFVLPDNDMHPPHDNGSVGEKDNRHELMSDCKDQAGPLLKAQFRNLAGPM